MFTEPCDFVQILILHHPGKETDLYSRLVIEYLGILGYFLQTAKEEVIAWLCHLLCCFRLYNLCPSADKPVRLVEELCDKQLELRNLL